MISDANPPSPRTTPRSPGRREGIAALATFFTLMHVQSVAWKRVARHDFFVGG
jgi:hypothetical protein